MICTLCCRRSPCGERGLKSEMSAIAALIAASLPVRGAWIEIQSPAVNVRMNHTGRSPCGERGLK